MTYEQFSSFAGTWGLVFLVVMFLAALVYTLWPGNKKMFQQAASRPLQNDEEEVGGRHEQRS